MLGLKASCDCTGGRVGRQGAAHPLVARPKRQQQQTLRRRVLARFAEQDAYSAETHVLLKNLLTQQAVRRLLLYLEETNGELHYYLYSWVAYHPLRAAADADHWLVELAASPLTTVRDPRRGSVVSLASLQAATSGEREISPREVCERILLVREAIAQEMKGHLERTECDNAQVMRQVLVKTVTDIKLPKV